ncbi:proteinaceous RNase P 1, chloroplastic/mitochondrial-like isoform X2 [Malania oleifera]|uniref:proteinaceous RNase P 1, chloroplastic/mitochondrial-like isoform X2 n=1 Tax=Malania oleifera TaxID=397392 RepID=UPI0025ADC394|nr:proteinaceous RNase P 1, chloroplastic/mitochondrial-like isoform X2 [Malania oleifera]
MASAFNTLQQDHFLPASLRKYSSTLNASKLLPFSSPLHTFWTPKRTLQPRFSTSRANVAQIYTELSTPSAELATRTTKFRNRKQKSSGTSRRTSGDEWLDTESAKTRVSSAVEEKTEKGFTGNEHSSKTLDSGQKSDMGSGAHGFSSPRSKNGNSSLKFSKTMISSVVVNGMDRISKNDNDNKVGAENIVMGSKKKKVDSSETRFRVALDMCSKRGDVLGAIRLYDLARSEGVEVGQYHYMVLLYLCSSAAVGVVTPAKSGKGARTLNTLDSIEACGVGEIGDMVEKNFGGTGSNIVISNNRGLVDLGNSRENTDTVEVNSDHFPVGKMKHDVGSSLDGKEYVNGNVDSNSHSLDDLRKGVGDTFVIAEYRSTGQGDGDIWVGEDVKKYALQRGFEIYERMCLAKVPMNEAILTSVARLAMSMGNGDMAFDMVKQMKPLGINPRLRSYSPALSTFCSSGDIDKAFSVEEHMLKHGVCPEEPDLEALLRISIGAGRSDKVYYLLHNLRTSVRKVSSSTADLIETWFKSKIASRVGKRKWDQRLIKEAIKSSGGGWHGQGWLGRGKWTVSHTIVGSDGLCKSCGERLALIDLDPTETENFAKSVASLAISKEKNSTFQKFQKWLDYYGPFEAVVDAANVGLLNQGRFMPSKINAVVNGIRQMLPSKRWPLIILHHKRVTGRKMDEPVNKAIIEKWKRGDAFYATPTGSNDDWYWLYAAIKFKCLIVTNDEMRDHTFQLLGNSFFPKWKERHQVHFSFSDTGPVFHMPPPCSVVIQESEKGHWHIPIVSESNSEGERTWLCVTRAVPQMGKQDFAPGPKGSKIQPKSGAKPSLANYGNQENTKTSPQELYRNLRDVLSDSLPSNHHTILFDIEAAEEVGSCVIDFQI